MAHNRRQCFRCLKEFTRVENLRYHLRKPIECECADGQPDASRATLLKNLDKMRTFTCDICNHNYVSAKCLSSHRRICKKKHNVLSDKEKLEQEVKMLKEEIVRLTQVPSVSATVVQAAKAPATSASPSMPQTKKKRKPKLSTPIHLRVFGDENLDYWKRSPAFKIDMADYMKSFFLAINPEEVRTQMESGDIPFNTTGIIKMIDRIYFDPAHPENHTVKYYLHDSVQWPKGAYIHGELDDGSKGWIKVQAADFANVMTDLPGRLFQEFIAAEFGGGAQPLSGQSTLISEGVLRRFLDIYGSNLFGLQMYPALDALCKDYSQKQFNHMKNRFVKKLVDYLTEHAVDI